MSFSALDSLLTGPLFATEPMRAVFSDEARIAAMLRMEAALARAEAACGLVPAALAPAIEALRPSDFDFAALGRATAIAGVPSIPFLKTLRERLPDALESHLHHGATTQDLLDTALVLQMAEGLALIEAEARVILVDLAALARAHRTTPAIGRSYGQHAAPLTFGYKVAIWAAGLAEIMVALPALRQGLLRVSLAGPVGTLSALGDDGPAVLGLLAAELGLGADPIGWHVRRARIAAAGQWVATLIGALAKMARDVVDLCSTEIGEVAEPHVAGRGGSSAMPHKRNPVSSTVILAAHTAARGHLGTLIEAMAPAHERPAGLWHAEWHALPCLFGLASGALREARMLSGGLEVDVARMRANIDLTRGLIFADAVVGLLKPRLGGARSHALVEDAAEQVRRSGQGLESVVSAMPEAAGIDLGPAFSLQPSTDHAAMWTDRALVEIDRIITLFTPP